MFLQSTTVPNQCIRGPLLSACLPVTSGLESVNVSRGYTLIKTLSFIYAFSKSVVLCSLCNFSFQHRLGAGLEKSVSVQIYRVNRFRPDVKTLCMFKTDSQLASAGSLLMAEGEFRKTLEMWLLSKLDLLFSPFLEGEARHCVCSRCVCRSRNAPERWPQTANQANV